MGVGLEVFFAHSFGRVDGSVMQRESGFQKGHTSFGVGTLWAPLELVLPVGSSSHVKRRAKRLGGNHCST